MEYDLTPSLEDYLETIFILCSKSNNVKPIDVSKAIGVSRASTTEAIKKLCSRGLVIYQTHNTISLSEIGTSVASDIHDKHNSLFIFFNDILGLPSNNAQDIACKIEHIVTSDLLLRIKMFNNYYLDNYKNEFKNKFCNR